MCDLIFCVFTPLIRRYIVRYSHCSWQALSHHGFSEHNIWNLSKGTLTVFFIEEKLCIVIYNNYRIMNTLCKDFFVLVHIKDLNESCIKINVGLGIIHLWNHREICDLRVDEKLELSFSQILVFDLKFNSTWEGRFTLTMEYTKSFYLVYWNFYLIHKIKNTYPFLTSLTQH